MKKVSIFLTIIFMVMFTLKGMSQKIFSTKEVYKGKPVVRFIGKTLTVLYYGQKYVINYKDTGSMQNGIYWYSINRKYRGKKINLYIEYDADNMYPNWSDHVLCAISIQGKTKRYVLYKKKQNKSN